MDLPQKTTTQFKVIQKEVSDASQEYRTIPSN